MPYYFSYVKDEKYQDEVEYPNKIVFTHPDDCTWHDLLNTFEQFIRGCGFVIGAYDKFQLIDASTGEPKEIFGDVIKKLIEENQRLREELDELSDEHS